MTRGGFRLTVRLAAFAFAVALCAGIVTAVLSDTDGDGGAVPAAEAGKRCIRTGGLRWCFSSRTAEFADVMSGRLSVVNGLPSDLVCVKVPEESTFRVATFDCDVPAP